AAVAVHEVADGHIGGGGAEVLYVVRGQQSGAGIIGTGIEITLQRGGADVLHALEDITAGAAAVIAGAGAVGSFTHRLAGDHGQLHTAGGRVEVGNLQRGKRVGEEGHVGNAPGQDLVVVGAAGAGSRVIRGNAEGNIGERAGAGGIGHGGAGNEVAIHVHIIR